MKSPEWDLLMELSVFLKRIFIRHAKNNCLYLLLPDSHAGEV
jgi:hypothetical protein